MNPIISIDHVSKSYTNQVVLDDICLDIPAQSIFGLLGPNGAGKTTLIRVITQITAPDSGRLFFNGEPLMSHHISSMGYLPEERGLYKKMEVGEQVLYLARLKGLKRADAMQRIKYWFEKFEIQAWWKKKVEELSKGMAQKVQFISTVLHRPQFLILDEPFTGFDPINAELIKNELLELRKNGSSIILSTHRMESVEELCTHISLMNHAKLILEGSVKDVRRQYKSNLYEIHFSGNTIGFTHALWTGFELIYLREEDGIQIARVKMLNQHTPNELLTALLPNVQVLGLQEIIPGMNDIFIQMVGETNPSVVLNGKPVHK